MKTFLHLTVIAGLVSSLAFASVGTVRKYVKPIVGKHQPKIHRSGWNTDENTCASNCSFYCTEEVDQITFPSGGGTFTITIGDVNSANSTGGSATTTPYSFVDSETSGKALVAYFVNAINASAADGLAVVTAAATATNGGHGQFAASALVLTANYNNFSYSPNYDMCATYSAAVTTDPNVTSGCIGAGTCIDNYSSHGGPASYLVTVSWPSGTSTSALTGLTLANQVPGNQTAFTQFALFADPTIAAAGGDCVDSPAADQNVSVNYNMLWYAVPEDVLYSTQGRPFFADSFISRGCQGPRGYYTISSSTGSGQDSGTNGCGLETGTPIGSGLEKFYLANVGIQSSNNRIAAFHEDGWVTTEYGISNTSGFPGNGVPTTTTTQWNTGVQWSPVAGHWIRPWNSETDTGVHHGQMTSGDGGDPYGENAFTTGYACTMNSNQYCMVCLCAQ